MDDVDSGTTTLRRAMKTAMAIGLLLAVALGSFLFGFIVDRKQVPPYQLMVSTYYQLMQNERAVALREWVVGEERPPDGGWHSRATDELEDLTPTQREEMRALAALGYVSGMRERETESGITVYDADQAFEGLNLYSSGHGPEARLLTMDGTLVHRWNLPFEAAFPDVPIHPNDERPDFWRKVHVFPNGDLLAIFEALGIIKVNKDSELLWASKNSSHHDMWVDDNGDVYVLTRTAKMIPEVDELHPVLEDFITVLGPDGVERRRHSILDAVTSSAYSSLMDYVDVQGDIFHTNTLEILDGRHRSLAPAFASGNALISMPNINTIAVVDLEVDRVVWALGGMFEFQHDPTFLDDGNLLVFDNLSHRPHSRVLELDVRTQEIVWEYRGDERRPFFSELIGTSQRLPNGNTLITESAQGRAFEVTLDGDIVWEFRSPHSAGENEELVAVLPEMKRLDLHFGRDWLTR